MQLKKIVIATPISFVGKKQVAPGAWTFNFTLLKPLDWKAGQHVILFMKTPSGKRVRRAFSLSSAPSEKYISITTRIHDTPSDFKSALKKLKKGDILSLRGPVGRLVVDTSSGNKYSFLATGIGITPFRSILKEMAETKAANKVTVFFAGNKDNHFFRDELSELNAKMPNLKIKYIYYPDRLMGSTVEELLGDELLQTIFFLSGSSKMIRSYRRTLTGLGIGRRNIKSDTFIGLRPHGAAVKESAKK
jgi:ferredoxin-NADP reductase